MNKISMIILEYNIEMKSFIILAILRSRVLVLRVIVPGNTAPFKEMLQLWLAVGDAVSDLTSSIFEPQTSRFRDKPFSRYFIAFLFFYYCIFTYSIVPIARRYRSTNCYSTYPRVLSMDIKRI